MSPLPLISQGSLINLINLFELNNSKPVSFFSIIISFSLLMFETLQKTTKLFHNKLFSLKSFST